MYYYGQQRPGHLLVMDGVDLSALDMEIADLERDFRVREIDITFRQGKLHYNQIQTTQDAYEFIRQVIFEGMEIQEHFVVLYLNNANRVIGYYHHSKGAINATVADVEIITAVAIKTLSKGLIISHNHPSGSLKPSEADRQVTRKLREALKLFDIQLLDHLIVTGDSYYSFASQGESSLQGSGSEAGEEEATVRAVRARIRKALSQVSRANSPNLWRMMRTGDGYRRLEEQIIRRMLRDKRIPEAIIPQMEMEWSNL
jgi:hypothetical protein